MDKIVEDNNRLCAENNALKQRILELETRCAKAEAAENKPPLPRPWPLESRDTTTRYCDVHDRVVRCKYTSYNDPFFIPEAFAEERVKMRMLAEHVANERRAGVFLPWPDEMMCLCHGYNVVDDENLK